jgi:hypothetical protein
LNNQIFLRFSLILTKEVWNVLISQEGGKKMSLQEILAVVTDIRNFQQKGFGAGTAIAVAIAGSFSFIIALALNTALQLSFAQIPVGSSGLFGAWIYAIIALILGIAALYLIYKYLQPTLHRKLD